MFRRAVPICAAVAVIGGAFAATSASGFPKKCTLHPEMTLIQGSRGAGNVGYRLTIRNSGPGACSVGRHPGLNLISESDEALPTTRVKTGPAGTVAIPVGGSVSARLRFSEDIPGPGEPGHGPCEPKAAKIRVHLGAGYRIGPIDPPTPVCDHGRIEEGSLH
jgi:hypothetical protein